jgi:CheY-like chemotaxis protein
VKLRDLARDIQAHLKKSSIDRKTRKRLRSYYDSGRLKLPRIFGYRMKPEGIVVVEDEAKVIRLILELLADGRSIPEIKSHLDQLNARNRSGNLFSRREILEIAKPAYAGLIQTRRGKWIRSSFYKPIVSVETLKSAQRAVQRLSEGADFGLPALMAGCS